MSDSTFIKAIVTGIGSGIGMGIAGMVFVIIGLELAGRVGGASNPMSKVFEEAQEMTNHQPAPAHTR